MRLGGRDGDFIVGVVFFTLCNTICFENDYNSCKGERPTLMSRDMSRLLLNANKIKQKIVSPMVIVGGGRY